MAGADLLYIDTFGDYGLDRLRAVSPVPVLGAGEASLAAVAAGGLPVRLVTVWPRSMDYLYDERMARCVGGDLVAGVHHFSLEAELDLVGTRSGVKTRMNRGESDLLDRLARACSEAATIDGAGAVLLVWTCMWSIVDELVDRTGIRILDPSCIGLRAAFESAGQVAVSHPFASDCLGAVTDVVDAWLRLDAVPTDGYDVCVFTPASATRHASAICLM